MDPIDRFSVQPDNGDDRFSDTTDLLTDRPRHLQPRGASTY